MSQLRNLLYPLYQTDLPTLGFYSFTALVFLDPLLHPEPKPSTCMSAQQGLEPMTSDKPLRWIQLLPFH